MVKACSVAEDILHGTLQLGRGRCRLHPAAAGGATGQRDPTRRSLHSRPRGLGAGSLHALPSDAATTHPLPNHLPSFKQGSKGNHPLTRGTSQDHSAAAWLTPCTACSRGWGSGTPEHHPAASWSFLLLLVRLHLASAAPSLCPQARPPCSSCLILPHRFSFVFLEAVCLRGAREALSSLSCLLRRFPAALTDWGQGRDFPLTPARLQE